MGAADIPAAPGGSSTAAGESSSRAGRTVVHLCVVSKPKSPEPVKKESTPAPKPEPTQAPAATQPAAQQTVNKSIQDFFDSIESEQPQPQNK
jgi:hypothetical protein